MSKPWPPPQIPKIPPEIELAANECKLVIFIGAGVSRLIGCPSWDEFANRALEQLAMQDFISYSDVQQLSHLDAKKRLSIAFQIADSKDYRLDHDALIEPNPRKESKIYEYIKKIGCVYVTTNYDSFLDISTSQLSDTSEKENSSQIQPRRELICRPDQFMPSVLQEPGTVVHLHGSIEDPKTMIIGTSHYLRHYNDEHVITFLRDLFKTRTVLFVGYGLEEMEILEHMLRKGISENISRSESKRQLFMLDGFYSHQEKTFKHLYEYYRKSFGVYLCHFVLDHLDRKQLEHLFEDWCHTLKVGHPLLSEDLKAVMEAINEES
jgi:NAD-dependent SIR2 family protein deacetylase